MVQDLPPLTTKPLSLLFLCCAVGPIGSGKGGGVELTVKNCGEALQSLGHNITVVAPKGSILNEASLVEIEGRLSSNATNQPRVADTILPRNSVLGNMLAYAFEKQNQYDLVINFCYDWLAFYMTPFFSTPVGHYLNLSSQTDALDDIIIKTAKQFPASIAVQSLSQVNSFLEPFPHTFIQKGLDLSNYPFLNEPKEWIGWTSRISPEKGLEDAFYVAKQLDKPLKIMGLKQNEEYWTSLCSQYPQVNAEYLGFLSTAEMAKELCQCKMVIMPIKWEETFSTSLLEALACGVPVVAYKRGSTSEVIQHGKTGWLIAPDNLEELVMFANRADEIDRNSCRTYIEEHHSLEVMGKSFESWFFNILNNSQRSEVPDTDTESA